MPILEVSELTWRFDFTFTYLKGCSTHVFNAAQLFTNRKQEINLWNHHLDHMKSGNCYCWAQSFSFNLSCIYTEKGTDGTVSGVCGLKNKWTDSHEVNQKHVWSFYCSLWPPDFSRCFECEFLWWWGFILPGRVKWVEDARMLMYV